ncbi:hydroxysqualene dehydroxylase HpnE [Chitinimonas sp.]|uniref:hydroxysqualene dehydroxylase HpnE n=1 Tax=Chitinimonas sp. TaxID=1934313 RepID=UPI002F92C376
MKTSRRTAVIGGGYAGMAAAMTLSTAGCPVDVYEAGPVLGGRARRIEVDGLALDNGQHMAIGAYGTLLGLMQEAGVAEADAFVRLPLELDVLDGPERAMRLACPRLPAPWHTLLGLLRAKGLSWAERTSAIRTMSLARLQGWRLKQDCSVADWLAQQRQSTKLVRCLWEPLTLAALNTPIASASAQILLNVLRDSLAADRAASDFLIPRCDLSAVFPEAAGRYISARGGQVQCGAMVRHLRRDKHGWQLDRSEANYEQIVVALPPHRLNMLTLPDGMSLPTLADWHWQPICTVYLRYPAGTRLPRPMQGMVGTTAQWLFDRGQLCNQDGLMAAVVSAEGPHQQWEQRRLAEVVAAEVARSFPALPAPLWQRVVAEKRATFDCRPGLLRPGNATSLSSLVLAGDYTAGDYPATLEGAVRSGVAAAQILLNR